MNSEKLRIDVGENNELKITAWPNAREASPEIRENAVKTLATMLGVGYLITSRKEPSFQSPLSETAEIADSNHVSYMLPQEVTVLAKTGRAAYVVLCTEHVGSERAVDATQLAREVKRFFPHLLDDKTAGYVSTGLAKGFQKLVWAKLVSYEPYTPNPAYPEMTRRRYFVSPEQAQKLTRVTEQQPRPRQPE